MLTTDIDTIITALKSDSTLTSLVPADNIKVGWVNEINSFPSIILTIIGDDIVGRLGYNNTNERTDRFRIQIDVYSSTSSRECSQIVDRIALILLHSPSFHVIRKTDDTQVYMEDANVWRRITTWEFTDIRVES